MTDEWEEYRYVQARTWLEHVRKLGAEVETARALVDSERDAMDGVKGVDYSAEHHGDPNDDAFVDAISKLDERIRDYVMRLDRYLDERHDASVRLSRLPDPTERQALVSRYLLGYRWEEVCVSMSYSYDGIMKLRRRAIVHAFDVMPTSWRDVADMPYRADKGSGM